MSNIYLTNRLKRVLNITEESLKDTDAIFPINIFLALLLENTGTLKNLNNQYNKYINNLYDLSININKKKIQKRIYHPFFTHSISSTTLEVINKSLVIMNSTNQIYLNEGHLLKAIFSSANEIKDFFSPSDIENILKITASPKDLIVDLNLYIPLHYDLNDFKISAASKELEYPIYNYVGKKFNYNWADTLINLFYLDKIPIYICTHKNNIIGFAAYDAFGSSFFGPMGVSDAFRNKKIGHSLLSICLENMKKRGDSYCLIKDAGPIEFYERCCNARLV